MHFVADSKVRVLLLLELLRHFLSVLLDVLQRVLLMGHFLVLEEGRKPFVAAEHQRRVGGHDELRVLEYDAVGIRRAAGDKALLAVAGEHAVPPGVRGVPFVFFQLGIAGAVADLIPVFEHLHCHLFVLKAARGTEREQHKAHARGDQFPCFSSHDPILCFLRRKRI